LLCGEKRNTIGNLVRKPEDKRPLGGLTHNWEYNIKCDFREILLGVMASIQMAHDGGPVADSC
jgi:hypothetical protein